VKSAIVSVERRDAGAVVHVRGEIEFVNSDEVRADLLATIPDDGPGLILDLTETTYLSSSGVRLLYDVAERLDVRDQSLVLVATDDGMIRRVVVLTQLENLVSLVATVDEALTALRQV
jgi:anti-anti-sigma factor